MDVPELLLWVVALLVFGLGGPFLAIFGGQRLADAISRWRSRRERDRTGEP